MKINTSFSRLTDVKFAAQVDLIITSLSGNANFPEPWPATVPSLAQLQADLTNYQSTINAAANGDRQHMVDRKAARQKLADELPFLAYYLQTVAGTDPTKLATSGFTSRRSTPRVLNPEAPTAPDQLKVQQGILSGQLVIRAKAVGKAKSYDVQTATADPTVESNWVDAGSYGSCRRIELAGLTPGKTYWVRVRALGSGGPGAWTPASSLMVV